MDQHWNKVKTMSKREKIMTFFRVVIIIVLIIGLTFQTFKLIAQYRKGMTVVSINYENKRINHLPGITICYPVALSMAKIAEKYPNLKPLYDEYMKRMNGMTENERKNMTSFQPLSDIYFNNFTKFIYHGEGDQQLMDYFDISIPNEIDERGSPTISVKIYGIPKNGVTDVSDKNGISDDTPIESLVFKHKNSWNKCFTFYSHLTEKWREFQMDITKVYILVSHNESWYPRNILNENELQLSMHSPDELPQHDVEYYVDLKPNRFIKLTYNQWKTHLLGEGYQTRCSDYKLNEEQNNHRMRSDCIKHCIQQKLRQISDCNETNSCETCLFLTTTLWSKSDLNAKNITNICNNFVKRSYSSMNVVSSCQSECRPKCEDRYYIYEIKMVSDFETPNTTVITIQHNQLPDQITQHIPEMTDIQFASNICVILVFLIVLFKF